MATSSTFLPSFLSFLRWLFSSRTYNYQSITGSPYTMFWDFAERSVWSGVVTDLVGGAEEVISPGFEGSKLFLFSQSLCPQSFCLILVWQTGKDTVRCHVAARWARHTWIFLDFRIECVWISGIRKLIQLSPQCIWVANVSSADFEALWLWGVEVEQRLWIS